MNSVWAFYLEQLKLIDEMLNPENLQEVYFTDEEWELFSNQSMETNPELFNRTLIEKIRKLSKLTVVKQCILFELYNNKELDQLHDRILTEYQTMGIAPTIKKSL